MEILQARFSVDLASELLIKWPDDSEPQFHCQIDDFEIDLLLIRDGSQRAKLGTDKFWTSMVRQIHVTVARNETDMPPVVTPNSNGIRDYSIQSDYFSQRTPQYAAAASEATNRIIRFFKYKLNTPFLTETRPSDKDFWNADWTNKKGEPVGKAALVTVAGPIRGLVGELSIKKLSPDDAGYLSTTITNPITPTLHEEILSDAQTAIFEHHFRRATIELAIVAEMMAKRAFFSEATPAGAAFDYLEDKSMVYAKVVDLIDKVALEAFGRSFRTEQSSHFENLENLFRCRNKVAHRGTLQFRNSKGTLRTVDSKTISEWWFSVVALIAWLNDLRPAA